MKIAIMQPYFLPYIGYWQLINAADIFVIYDAIEYTKKGWINRNRILVNEKESIFTIPLKKESDYKMVCQRELANSYVKEKEKILRKIKASYQKAPYFKQSLPVIENCFSCRDHNLFNFIYHSINVISSYLGIETNFAISSHIGNFTDAKGQDKILSISTSLGASTYINPIGGVNMYNSAEFKKHGINLQFLKPQKIEYVQFNNEFVPWLSIIDIMMFNNLNDLKKMLCQYDLI